MKKEYIVSLLTELFCKESEKQLWAFEDIFMQKFENVIKKLPITFKEICDQLDTLKYYQHKMLTYELKYLCLNFYLLQQLDQELAEASLGLSVRQKEQVVSCIINLISIGIGKNLLPNLPYHDVYDSKLLIGDIFYNYNILKFSTATFYDLITRAHVKLMIVPNSLKTILLAFYQIGFCPLKTPTSDTDPEYRKLVQDQTDFRQLFHEFQKHVHPHFLTRSTMFLFREQSPPWLRRKVSSSLTALMRSKHGVRNIADAMLENSDNDVTRGWRASEVLIKLTMSLKDSADFQENICKQLLEILDETVVFNKMHPLERYVVQCAQEVSNTHPDIFLNVFAPRLLRGWLRFAKTSDYRFGPVSDVSFEMNQAVRILHATFMDKLHYFPAHTHTKLKEIIKIVFMFYNLTSGSSHFRTMHSMLKEFMFQYLLQFTSFCLYQYFDALLFGYYQRGVYEIRRDIKVEVVEDQLRVSETSVSVVSCLASNIESFFKFFNTHLKVQLFGFLLKALMIPEKYFRFNNSLLSAEDDTSSTMERLLATHTALTKLVQDSDVIKVLKQQPESIVTYMQNVLLETVKKGTHKTMSGDGTELFFIVIMIIDTLIKSTTGRLSTAYECLQKPLKQILAETNSAEVKKMCGRICDALDGKREGDSRVESESAVEKALKDCCDELLPVRANGLLALSKLLEQRDQEALGQAQYLLNMFQLYLENDDSYVYLNAVRGLAALGDIYPATVLEVLCDQYTRYIPKEGVDPSETRMKLGEVLVKVIKKLGDFCPQYKALLLNTFLATTKDDDHLIRASSLANLGEVCAVLGYKLGTIVSEILVCVHGIITTDLAQEPRRAAVSVLRQLFVGLSTETLVFLKGELLPIYRSLKEIYYNDKDDVVRLQAQLALEQLNENMKEIMLAPPTLHPSKNLVILD